jgi:hypothetical protein
MTTSLDWEALARGLPTTDLRAMVEAALQGLASREPLAIISDPERIRDIQTRRPVECAIPQWTTAGGERRGVMVTPLSPDQQNTAAEAAHRWAIRRMPPALMPPAERMIFNPAVDAAREDLLRRRLMVEEVALATGLQADVIAREWNAEIVSHVYTFLYDIARYAPAVIAAELERQAGIPHPDSAAADDPHANDADAGATAGGGTPEPADGAAT